MIIIARKLLLLDCYKNANTIQTSTNESHLAVFGRLLSSAVSVDTICHQQNEFARNLRLQTMQAHALLYRSFRIIIPVDIFKFKTGIVSLKSEYVGSFSRSSQCADCDVCSVPSLRQPNSVAR
jgi:hypothetical protein